jgi:hypothetical protein
VAETWQEILARNQAAGPLATSTTPTVFMGKGASRVDKTRDALIPGTASDRVQDLPSAKLEFFKDEDLRMRWQEELYRLGLTKSPDDFETSLSAWEKAVELAAQYHQVGKNVTPWQVLDLVAGKGGRIQTNGPKTTVSRSKSTDMPTAGDIDHSTRSIFQEQMGRDPTESELARYRGIALREAKRNPAIVTTTTTTDPDGNSTSTSTRQGGFTANDLAEAQTKNASDDPEHGAYQASTFYFNALLDAIGPGA